MKKVCVLLSLILFFHLSINAQFKGLNLKKVTNYEKPINLRAFAIYPPSQQTQLYQLSGKIPGKADMGYLTHDATDKHSFLIMTRYWNRQKRISIKDEYALKLYAREFTPPKGYEGIVQDEKFYTENEGIIYVRKFARRFNEKEQDTISMIEVTYVAKHPFLKKEVIAFDLFMIGDNMEIAPAMEIAKQFISTIKPIGVYYNKKWSVSSEGMILTGTNIINTNLAYVTKYQSNTKALFAKADFNPTFVAGSNISVSRHIYRNIWVKAGIGLYSGTNNGYDSLYNFKEVKQGYFTHPLIYNAEFNTSRLNYVLLGLEKRLQLNGRNSINVFLSLRKSINDNYFQLSANDMVSGNRNYYKITYDNPFGFDLGAKYQHCFKYHHWGFNAGFGYSYTKYSLKKYTCNGVESSISTAPYFLPSMKQIEFSGATLLAGIFFQL